MSKNQDLYAKHMNFMNCVNSVCGDFECDAPAFPRLFKKHKLKLTTEEREMIGEHLQTVARLWFKGRTTKQSVKCGVALVETLDIISGVLPQAVKDIWLERRHHAEKVFGVDHFHIGG